MKPIDLHVHSTRSDGTYSPTQLVDYAIQKGLAAFALTDHDSVAGLDEAISYAEKLRATNPDVPEVIPGIEFSTEYQGRDIHIVGLYIDYHSPIFQKHIDDFVNSRDLRNEKMCDMLREKAGMDISYEKLQEVFPNSVITRAHYAKYMLEHGYIKNLKEAFERYIGDHCPYYVPREKVTPAQAIQLILAVDGIPVLAHPTLYGMGQERLNILVNELKNAGLIGIEAVYSTYTPAEEREMRTIAAKYGLAISGGSDFHGLNKPGLDLGTGYGKLYIPYDILTNLKSSAKNISG
ncbi:MAG: PHP domain-containing protein [Lachnospiraceae bacterium]|nr:PHP domain-containing protein [Lachnospiraceae bacterium]